MAQSKDNNKAQHSDTTVGIAEPAVVWWRKRSTLVVALVIFVALIAAGVWILTRPPKVDKAAEAAELRTLQTALGYDISNQDSSNQPIINTTTQIINGVQAGDFSVSNSQLAQYYLDRASSYLSQNQYSQATADSEAAIQKDSNLKLDALQIEFQARYENGERQPLIPILQQLVQLEQHSGNPNWGSTAQQYQDDIQSIQNNQEVNF